MNKIITILNTANATILLSLGALLLQSCGRSGSPTNILGTEIEFRYASNIRMEEHDGFSVAEIRNPWDTLRTLQRIILLDKDTTPPAGYPDATIVKVPLKNTVVYSSVHNSLIAELGSVEAIRGICDKEYIVDGSVKERLSTGRITDCGSSLTPNVESILRLSPDAVLLSPYENGGGEAKLTKAGIPVIECADYMETSPLGRAEWMKFYGRLYGKSEIADSLFNVTESEYKQLSEMVKEKGPKPKVLFDRVYGSSWSVPGGKSTVGLMIQDAGGVNPFEKYNVTGSVQLSPEKVVYEAGDADIWLIRYAQTPLNLETLKEEKPIYGLLKAYKNGNVYGSETIETNLFDDQAFHPQWVLKDMIHIFHPDIDVTGGKKYYEKLDNAN